MVDGTPFAHPLQHSTHPGHPGVFIEAQRVHSLSRGVVEHLLSDSRQHHRRRLDPRVHRTGEFQGASDSRLQTKLKHNVQQQTPPHPGTHASRNLRQGGPAPEVRKVVVLGQTRR